MNKKNNIIKKLLLSILIINAVLVVFSIRNLVEEYYLGYYLKYIVLLLLFIVSSLYFRCLLKKKNGVIYGLTVAFFAFVVIIVVDHAVLVNSIEKNGGHPIITKTVKISVGSKGGTYGRFIKKDGIKIREGLSSKEARNLRIGDIVILIESIQFLGQYEILNIYPSSEEIKKAKKYKYYYKGEYVDSIPSSK